MSYSDADLKQMLARGGARIKGEDKPHVKQKVSRPRVKKSPELQPVQVAGQIRQGVLTRIEILLPIRTESELNRRDHWRAAASRKHLQREEVGVSLKNLFKVCRVELPCAVKLTRIGANLLDSDNLASAFKAIRDEIARLIGIDDGSEMIRFEHDQLADRRAGYGIKIEILRPYEISR